MKVKDFIKEEQVYYSKGIIEYPIITIVLPTYCRGDNGLLERSISSVLNQSFKEFELIIVDDGSKDSTREVIEKFLENDNRIIYIRNEENSTLPALRVNQGLLKARGKYIAYQFDDDIWYEDAIETLYNEIIKYNESVLVYGSAKYIDTVTNIEGILGQKFNNSLFERGNIIPNNAVLHSKELLYLYGTYDCSKAMRRLNDWELWRRWSKKIPIIHIDKIISIVEARRSGSLAVNYDLNLLRAKEEKENIYQLLSLDNIEEYDIY